MPPVTDRFYSTTDDEDSARILEKQQIRKYGNFLEEFIANSITFPHVSDAACDVWDFLMEPISLRINPYEQTTVLHLINTDNKILNKVFLALSSLCCEIETLRQEADEVFYPALLLYGEGEPTGGLEEGEVQIQMGRMINSIQKLSCFITRAFAVAKNLVQQMAALYTSGKTSTRVIDVNDVHFQTVFDHLAKLLTVLITLDEIIANHPSLKEHWTMYKRTLNAVHHNPEKFGFTMDKLRPLEQLVKQWDSQIFEGYIFQGCIDQQFDEKHVLVTKSTLFQEEFAYMIRWKFAHIESKIGEASELDERVQLVGLFGLFAFHFQLFRVVDRKIFKQLWDIHKKLPGVTLVGNVVWFPARFLLDKIPYMDKHVDNKAKSTVFSSRETYLKQAMLSLPKFIQNMTASVNTWMIRMDSACSPVTSDQGLHDNLKNKTILFIQGLLYASTMGHYLRLVMNMHVALSKPMGKSSVLLLCSLIELIKSAQITYYRHSTTIGQYSVHILQQLALYCLNLVATAKKRLISDKKYSERRLDVLSALVLAENCLNGPCTRERRLIIHMASSFAIKLKCFKEDELSHFLSSLKKMEIIAELNGRVADACDSSLLYWHRILIPIYLSDLFETASDTQRIHCMFAALHDCFPMMSAVQHLESPNTLLDVFKTDILGSIETSLLKPLFREIETELRLHAHSHLQLDDRNPFKVRMKDLSQFFRLKPVRFADQYIDVKAEVEHYLSRTIYNLTALTLHDWKTYDEMKHAAQQKYGLQLCDSHLPSQTLEQGLDVLEIMRSIDVFVSKYLYNLNTQIFVEQTSNNKHLNTINIRHVANSIRTHGTGIMNTTVNYTYQFLVKKFKIFSQFLFDDHIKSRLIKDWKYFKENHMHKDQKYPFERAEKFNRGIRTLGVKDGLSFLDKFRMLISQIGNAMGYVRMIRSGGLHCCSSAIRFIPDLDDIASFEDLCAPPAENALDQPASQYQFISSETKAAARNLDLVIGNLTKNFEEGAEYFKLLVDVFAPEFRHERNMHLKQFFVIVPPLTLNFVEYFINAKEKLNKKNKIGAAFTDDGFAMGVAYILKLLDQYSDFDSLHWFQSISDHYTREKQAVQKELKASSSTKHKSDDKLQETLMLKLKRYDIYMKEFELLNYSLSSARIFFHGHFTTVPTTVTEQSNQSSSAYRLLPMRLPTENE